MKKPKHCKDCIHFHKAGHPKGSNLRGGKYDCWCSHFGTSAPNAVSICIQQNFRNSEAYLSWERVVKNNTMCQL